MVASRTVRSPPLTTIVRLLSGRAARNPGVLRSIIMPAAGRLPVLRQGGARQGFATSIEEQYAKPLKYLHWGMGGGVIAALALTWVAKYADPEMKATLMGLHESIGLLVIGQATSSPPPPRATRRGHVQPRLVPH